ATELGDLLPATRTEFVTGSESWRDHQEPHAPDTRRPHNHQAFTVCFAVDHVEGEDNTIEKPNGYDFWRKYEPRLTPAWQGNLLSWETSAPSTLTPREMGFDPTGPTPNVPPTLWTYRRIVAAANVIGGSDVCLVNWPQNDFLLSNLFGPNAERQEGAFAHAM